MDTGLARALPSAELGREIRRVPVGGVDVLLGRLATGEVVAFSTTCPHQATDLADASLLGESVQCPLHSYAYDLRTGANVVPSRDADPADLWKLRPGYLPVFRAEERDGWIWVGAEPLPPPASYDPVAECGPVPVPVGTAVDAWTEVQVVLGTTFELRLPTAPRPGFVWRVEAGDSSLAVVGERVERGEHVVRMVARAAGQTVVRCTYARPWDREPAEVRIYEVVVVA